MNNKFLQGFWKSCMHEYDLENLNVIGQIPKNLNGTFYRNGPNPQFVFSDRYHMFDGDGMIHALTLQNGKASYKNRWVRTKKFLAERTAGRSLFGGFRDRGYVDPSAVNIPRNNANTNIIWHHQKLLALNEGSLPVLLDTKNIEQHQDYFFGCDAITSMTAHPKIDPVTGEMICFNYFNQDGALNYFVVDKNGLVTHFEKIMLPYQSLMHDVAITEHYTIFQLFPLTWSFQRLMTTGKLFAWEPNLNTRFAIIPRYGRSEDVMWFEFESCLGMHVANAYEENNMIHMDMVIMDDIPDQIEAFANDDDIFRNYLTCWTFDLKSKKVFKQRLDESNMEFPRVDERFVGRDARVSFLAATQHALTTDALFDSIVKFDNNKNEKQIHDFGIGSFALEPIFIPKSANAKCGEGYLLTYVYREKEDRSELVILNAEHVDDAPIATVQLGHRVPFGFHGCWV